MSFFQSSTVQLADASLTKISFIKKNGVPETVPKIIQTGLCYKIKQQNNKNKHLWHSARNKSQPTGAWLKLKTFTYSLSKKNDKRTRQFQNKEWLNI